MDNSLNRLFDLLEGLKEQMSWKAVYGQPQTQGERTIIPVAAVRSGVGMAFGWGTDEDESRETAADEGEPAGAGAGGTGMMGRPVAIIEITPEKTTVRPVIDYARLILAGLFAFVWIASLWSGMLSKLLRPREEQRS